MILQRWDLNSLKGDFIDAVDPSPKFFFATRIPEIE